MELQEFIETSLVQICLGIKGAQEKLWIETGNWPIAPSTLDGKVVHDRTNNEITFDVGISVSKDRNINVAASVIGVGGKTNSTRENSQTQRVQFSVPFYPQSLNPKKREPNE